MVGAPAIGGGALPLEAQRLGLESYASDLNPVAVLINKAMIEIPPKFAGRPPVNPESRRDRELVEQEWTGARGLAADLRYYGQWMRDEAENRIGWLYPKVEVTAEMAEERPDIEPYVGRKLTVIAWLWACTVKSPNPAFADVDVPLASTFMLSTKTGKEAYVEPVIENGGYRFTVKVGKPEDVEAMGVYLAFALSKLADRGSTICTWFTERDSTRNTFARQSIPMTWDYAELNTLLDGTGSFLGASEWTAESIEGVAVGRGSPFGAGMQADAGLQTLGTNMVISTDPPYYDNNGNRSTRRS